MEYNLNYVDLTNHEALEINGGEVDWTGLAVTPIGLGITGASLYFKIEYGGAIGAIASMN